MKLRVQYFARYRETLGIEEEFLDTPQPVDTLGELRDWLLARGDTWSVLAERNLMCARNQELCGLQEPLVEGDEVAFFPPVTGG